jgi:L-lysine 2,3-aminomutase
MIDPSPHFSPPPVEASAAEASWQEALRHAVRDAAELARLLELPLAALGASDAAGRDFPLLVPRGFVARMRKRDADDPLLRQVLPRAAELIEAAGFGRDPLAESAVASGGVLRKYAGRALLITTGACPVHCRYCFRRAFPYADQLAARDEWAGALEALRRSGAVSEVILSGGDPLSLANSRLAALLEALEDIPSVRAVRIHTRFPIMLPERVDRELCSILSGTTLKTVTVVHCNHPNELDAGVAAALARLGRSTHWLLNQAVLLRGVNDDARVLAALSERLFDCGVLPYYLHLLDPIAGAVHFEVDEARGRDIMAELRARLPGYLVPRLVREIPGESSKTLVA